VSQRCPATSLASVYAMRSDGPTGIVDMTHLGSATDLRVHFHGHLHSQSIHPHSLRLVRDVPQTPLMIYDPKTDPQLKSWLVKNLEPMSVHPYPRYLV
jgi:hypothetical protein